MKDSSASLVNAMYIQGTSMNKFWDFDTIRITEPVPYKSIKEMELTALSHFSQTMKTEDNGRYGVVLP
jgi:hypothetical protein